MNKWIIENITNVPYAELSVYQAEQLSLSVLTWITVSIILIIK